MASEIPTSMLNFTLNSMSLRLNFKFHFKGIRALVICELIVNNDTKYRIGCNLTPMGSPLANHLDIFT
jgi:hypothetical protein